MKLYTNFRAILLALVFCAAANCVEAYNTTVVDGITWYYTVTNGEAMIGRFSSLFPDVGYSYSANHTAVSTDTAGDIVIPKYLDGYKVTRIGYMSFCFCSKITSLTIPDSIVEIGRHPFYSMSSLKTVRISDIDAWAQIKYFDGSTDDSPMSVASSLLLNGSLVENIQLSEGVHEVGDYAFWNCSSLKKVVLPSTVTNIGMYAFRNCASLIEITFPSALKKIGNTAFYQTNLKTVHINDIASFKNINFVGIYAFPLYNGASLYVSGELMTRKQAIIGGDVLPAFWFYNDTSLADFEIPTNVCEIGTQTFYGCSNLKHLKLPDAIKNIGNYAFYGCDSIESIIIPDGVETIGSFAFAECSHMIDISLPDSIEVIGQGAFMKCSSLRSVRIPEGVTGIKKQTFYGCQKLKEIVIPASLKTVEGYSTSSSSSYSYNPFYNCGSPRHVIFNGSVLPTGNGMVQLTNGYNTSWSYVKSIGGERYRHLRYKHDFNSYSDGSTPRVWSRAVVRDGSPDIIDVTYKVYSTNDTVRVRAVGFENGNRSFANIVRVKTLVDGTENAVGDNVTANEEHTLSWRVSSDWTIDLAKVSVEILACENEVMPMELIELPATKSNPRMQITWNCPTKAQLFDALLWYYADGASELTVDNGIVKASGSPIAMNDDFYTNVTTNDPSGYVYDTYVYHTKDAFSYVVGKKGFSILQGTDLDYANHVTRLNLTPDTDAYGYYGERQYAVKKFDD